MAAGFQAWNDGNLVQIDGMTPNYQMVRRITTHTQQTSLQYVQNDPGTWYYTTRWYVQFTFTASNPLYAFVGSEGVGVTPWKFSRNGNTFTAEFIAVSECDITLFVWDYAEPTNLGFGLQVFNEQGTLVADATTPFCRVIDVVEGTYVDGYGWRNGGFAMPGANTQSRGYGVPVAFAGAWPAALCGDNNKLAMSAFAYSGGGMTWWLHRYMDDGYWKNFVGFADNAHYRFMVLDMTGII